MVKAMPREKERFCKRECVRGDAEDERPAVSSDSEQEEEQGFEHDDMDVMVRMLLCHGIFSPDTPTPELHAPPGSWVASSSALLP